jgi:lipopolysaccharide biosynthesis protein
LALDAEIEVFENRGRDMLPFLHVANRLLDEGVSVVLKLHTKRSVHRRDGEQWRNELLQKLVSPERVPRIITAFSDCPKLGLVAAEGHVQPLEHFWGGNEENVRSLCMRLGFPVPGHSKGDFVAGSMFWIRLESLRPLLDAHMGAWEFDTEAGQIDGTTAHAIERLISLVALNGGFETREASQVCGFPSDQPPTPYPYAQRG